MFQPSDLPCVFVFNQKRVRLFSSELLFIFELLYFWTYLFFPCIFCFCRFALPALRRPMGRLRAWPRESLLAAIFIIIFVQWESMAALWTEHGKMMKFGTLIIVAMNSDLTNFGVSKTTSIAPPPVQNFNIEMVITREHLILEKWNLVHLITLIMLITCNSLQ